MNEFGWWIILVWLNPQMPSIHCDVIELSMIWHTRMNRAIALHRHAQKRARREEPSVPCGASQKPLDQISTQFVERNYLFFNFTLIPPSLFTDIGSTMVSMQTPQCIILWSLSKLSNDGIPFPAHNWHFEGVGMPTWLQGCLNRTGGARWGSGWVGKQSVTSRDFAWFFGINLLFKA